MFRRVRSARQVALTLFRGTPGTVAEKLEFQDGRPSVIVRYRPKTNRPLFITISPDDEPVVVRVFYECARGHASVCVLRARVCVSTNRRRMFYLCQCANNGSTYDNNNTFHLQ